MPAPIAGHGDGNLPAPGIEKRAEDVRDADSA